MGYSKLWKFITIGFVFLGIGRAFKIVTNFNVTVIQDPTALIGSVIIVSGLLFILYGHWSLNKVVKSIGE